jgi:hypothetical protein
MRRAQRIALLATVFVAVSGAGAARADWQTDRAQAIAAKLWNHPCGGKVELWHTAPPEASWRAWTYPSLCGIALSDTAAWKWRELCPVLMHEYGHLAGYSDPLNPSDSSHSHDPNDIMFPFEHYDPRCDDYGAAFLGVPRPPEARVPVSSSMRRKVVPTSRARRVKHGRRSRATSARRGPAFVARRGAVGAVELSK